MAHLPVLLTEILNFLPGSQESCGNFLDVTAGGGGHFAAILKSRSHWKGECWDKDPLAERRLFDVINQNSLSERALFRARSFGEGLADPPQTYDFILADLGVSSFQLDDKTRGMSLFSDAEPDFRMNPNAGPRFFEWLQHISENDLYVILEEYGEEPRAKKLAKLLKQCPQESISSAKKLAQLIENCLAYKTPSRVHPATRSFQAFRIAMNDELGELRRLLTWAPAALKTGGRLAIISFHSLEDRLVKNAFRDLATRESFGILNKKPIVATEVESSSNPRSRSAKLRVLERLG